MPLSGTGFTSRAALRFSAAFLRDGSVVSFPPEFFVLGLPGGLWRDLWVWLAVIPLAGLHFFGRPWPAWAGLRSSDGLGLSCCACAGFALSWCPVPLCDVPELLRHPVPPRCDLPVLGIL